MDPTYGVRYFSELTNMACLTEEVGELARIMARTYGDQSFKAGEKKNLADEMADVLWVLVCLANQTGVDLTAAMEPTSPRRPPAIGNATSTTRSSGTEPSEAVRRSAEKSPVPESAEASDTGFAYGKSEKDDTASGRPRRTAAPDGCIGRSGQIPFGRSR